MTANSVPVSSLPTANALDQRDRVLVLYNASSNALVANGTPSVRTISLSSLGPQIKISNVAPSNSTSNGLNGSIAYDTNYFYVCISNNYWLRTSLSTW